MSISSAVDASAVARVVGIKTIFKDLRGEGIIYLPQRVALIGQGASLSVYSTDKRQVTSANEVGSLYGFGSPLHLAALQLLPINGDGLGTVPLTVYPMVDDGAGVAAAGDITPSGAPTAAAAFKIRINNIDSEEFVIAASASVADRTAAITEAINAILEMPVIAVDSVTQVDFTAKWKGTSGNDIYVEVVPSGESEGNIFTTTQATGGLVNPDVQDALNLVGNVWETMVLNCLDIADTTTLDTYSTFGEGRWGALVRKPLMVFTGNTATTVTAATAISDARKTDRVNAQLVAPGSKDLPLVIAARQLARIAVVANNNPPVDYGSQSATGLNPGADGDQWTYADRDTAVKKGSSTVEIRDSVVTIADVITFYHPTGDPIPAYRYVVDIVKLQNILFNLDLIFVTPVWDGAPLIPDNQPTTNRAARKPKDAKAAIAAMVDSLALNAIVSGPEDIKSSILAAINESNPKRLDISFTASISGNTNIISIDFNFGFYFGTAPIVT